MEYVTWTAVVALILLVLLGKGIPTYLWNYYCRCKVASKLPGLPCHWLWGDLSSLPKTHANFFKWIHYIQKTGHKITRVWGGPFMPLLVVHHSDPLRKLVKQPKDESRYGLVKCYVGEGVFSARGEKWRQSRRLLTPAFHFEILKSYTDTYNSCLEVLITKWAAAARTNETVKVFENIKRLSLDIFFQCACSYKSGSQSGKWNTFLKTLHDLTFFIYDRAPYVLYSLGFIHNLITAANKRQRQMIDYLDEKSKAVFQERKHLLKMDGSGLTPVLASKGKNHLGFLDLLLSVVDEKGNGLTDKELRDEMNTFIVAGHDTTTSGMSWALYCLAKYPEHQEKVREEVMSVLDGREWLNHEDLNKLQYTLWCIKESMRLYPSIPMIFRQASEEVELDGHRIPKGMTVGIYIFTIHRHPDLWENPNEYDPLRFHPDNSKDRDPMAYIPFSVGKRNCLGQNFAVHEMRIVIATLISRFSISLVEDHNIELAWPITLIPNNDIKIQLKLLQDTV